MIEELTIKQAGRILGVSKPTIEKLIKNNKLRGWVSQPGRLNGTRLSIVATFLKEYGFPSVPLLSFVEEYRDDNYDPKVLGIDEPIGVGGIRFYPEEFHILTTGKIANLSHISVFAVTGKWFDDGLLNGYRIPTSGEPRRATVDDYLRFVIRYNIPYEEQRLEEKTTLLADYPGRWIDGDKLTDGGLLWYRENGAKEISVREGEDGLFVKSCDDCTYLILTGMTGREEQGQLLHLDHVNRINYFLNRGIKSAQTIDELDISGVILGILEHAQEILKENYEVKEYQVTKGGQLRIEVLKTV